MAQSRWASMLASLVATACSGSPSGPAPHSVPSAATSQVSSASAPPESVPADYAGVKALLQRAPGEAPAERSKTYGLVRQALSRLTEAQGSPMVLVEVGGTWKKHQLLPAERFVDVVSWGAAGLLFASDMPVVSVGPNVVSLELGKINVRGTGPPEVFDSSVTSEGVSGPAHSLTAPEGATRYVLVTGHDSYVFDTQTGDKLFQGPAKGAALVRSASGATRLAQLDGKKGYVLREVPEGTEVARWPRLGSVDESRGLAVVRDVIDGRSEANVSLVRIADGTVLAKYAVPKGVTRTYGDARISPDGRSIAYAAMGGTWRLDFDTGRDTLLAPRAVLSDVPSTWFTKDGKHVCIDPLEAPAPPAALLPGTMQRCDVARNGVAHVAYLAAPRPPWKRATEQQFPSEDLDVAFGTVSNDGALAAATLYSGARQLAVRQPIAVAVYDARTGKELWTKLINDEGSLGEGLGLQFSDDLDFLFVAGFPFRARTGELVQKKTELFKPLLARFGVAIDDSMLLEPGGRLMQEIWAFPKHGGTEFVARKQGGLLVLHNPLSGTVALLPATTVANANVFIPGKAGAIAFVPGGKFAVQGTGDDLVCAFGDVLAPIDVCRGGPDEVTPAQVAETWARANKE